MKKLRFLFALIAMAFCFASCSDFMNSITYGDGGGSHNGGGTSGGGSSSGGGSTSTNYSISITDATLAIYDEYTSFSVSFDFTGTYTNVSYVEFTILKDGYTYESPLAYRGSDIQEYYGVYKYTDYFYTAFSPSSKYSIKASAYSNSGSCLATTSSTYIITVEDYTTYYTPTFDVTECKYYSYDDYLVVDFRIDARLT